MKFNELNLLPPLLQALHEEGYTSPTPIQQQAIPPVLQGRDLLGCAQTGTGKTAAFALPILQSLEQSSRTNSGPRRIKSLILTPTRELAIQIEESIATYGKYLGLKQTVVFGGVSQHPQTRALRSGVDILVATPGRLLDLCQQRFVDLSQVEIFVLDEADRMLDMGFINDVKKVIAKLPAKRQTLLLSATLPDEISQLSKKILINPVRVEVTPNSSTVEIIDQRLYFVDRENKLPLLIHLLNNHSIETALVFSRTTYGADKACRKLKKAGIEAQAIHGRKSQNNRQKALQRFKAREIRILVATDIAARGIDIDNLSHVINLDLPNVPESYVHRIGRTARAGNSGHAISFCSFDEKKQLRDIQKLIKLTIPVVTDHPFPMQATAPTAEASSPGRSSKRRSSHHAKRQR